MKSIMGICVVVCLLPVAAMGGYTQGYVDLDNLQALANDWMNSADMEDFAMLAQYWLTDQTPPAPDHHWPLEETSGTEVNDIIAYEKLVEIDGYSVVDGSIVGRIGNGLRFEGGNEERISHPTLLDDLDATDSITIMAWVRPMSGNNSYSAWFQKQNNSAADQLHLCAEDGQNYRVKLRNNGNDGGGATMSTITSGVAVEADVWRHFTWVWTPTSGSLYIDGKLEGTAAEGTMGAGTYYDMTLGTSNLWLNPFGGTLDDFRIYNTALSAAQISNVYDSYSPVTLYDLKVNNGTGGDNYLNDVVVEIAADDSDLGFVFDRWVGDTEYLANPYDPTTTVTMPAYPVSVTAVYTIVEETATLTVNNGSGSGNYPENTFIEIEANTPDANHIFTGWAGDTQYLANPNTMATSLIMPDVDITVTAAYANKMDMLTMHWPLEETSGTISENVASDVDDLIAITGFSIADRTTTGRVNNAFTFEDNSQALEVPGVDAGQSPAGLDIFPDQLTVMGWLKFTDGTNGDSIFVSKKPTSMYGFYCVVDDDYFDVSLQLNSTGRSNRISGTTVNPESDTWYHYAMTWVGNDMRLYVDGVQDGATYTGYDIADFPDAEGTAGYDTTIGTGWVHVQAYAGVLDEIKIFKAALSPQQILEEYESVPSLPLYTLAVISGTGDGSYAENTVVDIVADTPPAGQVFDAWIGDTATITDVYSPTTTVTMPAAGITVTATYINIIIQPSVAWWEMEEMSGTVAYDSTVNAYDLVPTDGFVIADAAIGGMVGNGFLFDGSGERLTHPTLLDDFPDAITIAGWIRPDATGMSDTQSWFSKINADALGYSISLTCKMSGSTPNVLAANGRSDGAYMGEYFNCNSTITWVDDTWYHIAFTWDATGCEIYVDGQPEGSDDMPIMGDVIPGRNAVDLTIGNGGDTTQPLTEPFKGALDDVMIYDSVLSALEILDLSGIELYPLVVNSGTGSGSYAETTVINIVADTAPAGQEFDVWTGDVAAVADIDDPTTTVTMPAAAVTVTATYQILPVLTVNSGTGSGSYAETTVVNIAANTPPAGLIFDAWTGDTAYIANITDSTTTVTMPAQNITVTATYQVSSQYTLTVINGTGDGSYEANTVVNIAADTPPAGQVFDVWVGDIAYVANVNSQATTVTMPAGDVSVTATYKLIPSVTPSLAWWEMEETSGVYAYDSTGNGYNLLPSGDITIAGATTTGKIGKAFMISGNGSRFTHSTLLDTVPSGLTIMGWTRPDASYMTSGMCWFSKQNGTPNGSAGGQLWMKFGMSSGQPSFIQTSYRAKTSSFINLNGPSWSDDTWYHYAFTWNSATNSTKLYIDGDLEDSSTGFMGNATGGVDLSVGSGGLTSQAYKGLIDDVRLYDSALSGSEIVQIYNNSGAYLLTVNNGSGDGSYNQGQVVGITADEPPLGDEFDVWTGDTATIADIHSPSTTVTMPAGPVTLTATYKPVSSTPFIMNIRTNFPGGNALINGSATNPVDVGDTVGLAPDLRDNAQSWFYWCVEATANQPGEATFILPSDHIGYQGPAVSYDGGVTWDWMGTATVNGNEFTHYFTQNYLTVRFAVTIPYLQSDLDAFLTANASNQHLTESVLVQTNEGRNVELLQIGTPDAGKTPVLFTCRHHACETMASFLVEGFMQEAISNSADAIAFRNNYVLYVVPFVDKDGVEKGDQGKNRSPHDHNRDYGLGTNRLYEEVGAIEALYGSKSLNFVMDWHCPTLRLSSHQLFYFVGSTTTPTYNNSNVSAFAVQIDSEFPTSAPTGPLNWMDSEPVPTRCDWYFTVKPGIIMSTTLEVPFAPVGKNMSPAACRSYGADVLRAWMDTNFQ